MSKEKTLTKRSRNKSHSIESNDASEEEKLESYLFGRNKYRHQKRIDENDHKISSKVSDDDADAKWVDDDDSAIEIDVTKKLRLKKLRKSKDERVVNGKQLESMLRSRFQQSNFGQDWVNPQGSIPAGELSSSEEDEELALLTSAKPLKSSRQQQLFSDRLYIVRCKDANQQDPSCKVISSVNFHGNGTLLLAAGLDKSLRFFEIDGENNRKVFSICFNDFPIQQASFCGKTEAIVSGKRPYFYHCNVETGLSHKVHILFGNEDRAKVLLSKFVTSPDGTWIAFSSSNGYIMLVSATTKQWVTEFKINSLARALAFSPDSQYLYASGADAEVYTFDMKQRKCIRRMFNEGGTGTGSIDLSTSNDGHFLAVGSDSGVVNIYDEMIAKTTPTIGVLHPKPLYSIMNLTTPITAVKFNHDSQILAILSSEKRNAMKFVHVSSGQVFQNWPTERTPLRYPSCIDFSPTSKFVAIGNTRGCVLLYKLSHYGQGKRNDCIPDTVIDY